MYHSFTSTAHGKSADAEVKARRFYYVDGRLVGRFACAFFMLPPFPDSEPYFIDIWRGSTPVPSELLAAIQV